MVWKKAEALSPLFFNFYSEYDITNVQANQNKLKFYRIHQLWSMKVVLIS
jgi:hypothetical protein